MPSDATNSLQAPDFMKYPSPGERERARILAQFSNTQTVSEETKKCITNLLAYHATRMRARLPRGASAAVLVPLFVGRSGEVYVLLSRRSDTLKTFAGDTALPGGRVDAQDGTVEDTARREAFEEIGLPWDKERVPLLCVMEPHLARGEIIVTPVVALILDHSLQPNLNTSEVASIFAQPLITFLSSLTPPHHQLGGHATAGPNRPYYTFTDIPWGDGGGAMRLHRFLTGREGEGVKPVFGLTSSILVKTATIGYGYPPDFEVQPPNAPTPWQQIARALLTPGNPLRVACEREGIDASAAAGQLLHPPLAGANAAPKVGWEELLEGGGPSDDACSTGQGVGRHSCNRQGVCERAKEVKKRAVGCTQVGMDGPSADVRAHQKHAQEKQRLEREVKIPDMNKIGTFLDETRDQVTEQMREQNAYHETEACVEKYVEELRGEDSTLEPTALVALIPEERRVKDGEEGAERAKEEADNDDGNRQGQDRSKSEEGVQRGFEKMKNCAGMGGNGGDPKQTILLKKRDPKL